MNQDVKQAGASPAAARSKASVGLVTADDVALVTVAGLVDERFSGFGQVGAAKIVVIDVSGITRMTSFGVRQWLKGMDALPKGITDLYLLGCPTFFVDQLNMVLNFGGASKVLSVVAPYTCPSCGVESGETIDVLAERANLAKGGPPQKECARCGGTLEFDETPESYFSFVGKYGASSIQPAAAKLLGASGLYRSADVATEKPPRIIKLVHESVSYFRIIGTIGAMFRARPFLVGAEGEIVIDLADVDRFDASGQKEWRRLLRSFAGQVSAVTLVDVNESFLVQAGDTLAMARSIAVASVLAPYACRECKRTSNVSEHLLAKTWAGRLPDGTCSHCGGITSCTLAPELMAALNKANMTASVATARVIDQRADLLARALTDVSAAVTGEVAATTLAGDGTILGKYKIVRKLSGSRSGEVFLAKQVGIGGFEKPVALKRIQRKLLESRRLTVDEYLNQATIAGRLIQPNIVQVLDIGVVDDAVYVAMEYVRGKDLEAVTAHLKSTKATMPLGEACYIAREIALALDHACWSADMGGRRLGVVHRDVSPHNIMLSYDGAVKLRDFGVAIPTSGDALWTGSVHYLAPEAAATGQGDHRSDLFSLGVVLYQLCYGQVPFGGSDPKDVAKRIRTGRYKALEEVADVPAELAQLVGRMLAQNPDERPQRGQEVVAALNDIARRYAMESSGPAISAYLAKVFGSDVANDAAPVPESRGRASAASVASAPLVPARGSRNMDIDVSVALTPGTRDDPDHVTLSSRPTLWLGVVVFAGIALLVVGTYLLLRT